jgi:hypothetical protein
VADAAKPTLNELIFGILWRLLLGKERRSEIASPVDHPQDLNDLNGDPIENDIRVNWHRSQLERHPRMAWRSRPNRRSMRKKYRSPSSPPTPRRRSTSRAPTPGPPPKPAARRRASALRHGLARLLRLCRSDRAPAAAGRAGDGRAVRRGSETAGPPPGNDRAQARGHRGLPPLDRSPDADRPRRASRGRARHPPPTGCGAAAEDRTRARRAARHHPYYPDYPGGSARAARSRAAARRLGGGVAPQRARRARGRRPELRARRGSC